MSDVKLYLFGNPRLDRHGAITAIHRHESIALLAYLALGEQPTDREALAALIWPELEPPAARDRLRRELARLRRDIGPAFSDLQPPPGQAPAGLWLDVRRFRQCIALVQEHDHFPQTNCADCLAALQEATTLHTAAFLDGFSLPDAPAFAAWQSVAADTLLRQHSSARQRLVDHHRLRGEHDQAAQRRFELREPMPAGGQGALFRGVDHLSGEAVVIKQLRPEQLNNPDYVARFVREGEMLRRLNHPNIVRVLATYDDDGKHCLVMEFVEGGSLRDLLQAHGPLPEKRALEIGIELADALGRAHHLGIIHRDVKPANVLIAADGAPRLTDFGLARLRRQRLDLTPTGTLLGTPYYMSPEALRGEELDERSDIWSFGALLFEMLTGQPPFPGQQMAHILTSILNDPAPALEQVRPDLSPGLAALLRRMLTKDREARIYSMRLIAAGLEALRHEWPGAAGLRLGLEPEPARPRLADSARQAAPPAVRSAASALRSSSAEDSLFVGRQTELEALLGQLELALAGQPQAAFIVGEAGAGKTTLMQTFARAAQAAMPQLLVAGGEGNAFSGSGDPFLPFREILEMLTGEVRAPSAYGQLSPYDTQRLQAAAPLAIAALVEEGPDLLKTMLSPERLLQRATGHGDLALAGNGWTGQLKAMAAEWSLQQTMSGPAPNALFEQYARVLQRLTDQRPLLLLLDDVQWVDEASASLLLHLGRRLGGARLLLALAYRPGHLTSRGEDGRQALQWALGELQRDLSPLVVDLNQVEGRAFVDALLDAYPNRLAPDFRDTLFRLTRGNPLFAIELLRGMQERGDLVQDGEGQWRVSAALDWQTLPARVEGAIGERLGRLDARLLELLQVASVEGEEFTAEVVAGVLGLPPRNVVQMLSRQLDRQHRMVRSLGIAHNGERRLSRYGFRHNLIQRYLYNSLDDIERVYQHEEVGRALAALYGDQAVDVAMELALHFEQAALTPETIGYLKLAAEQAMRRGVFSEAMRRLEHALELLAALPEGKVRAELELRLQLLRARALVTTLGVADPDAESAYLRALQLAEQLNDTAKLGDVLYGLATLREYQGNYAQSQALLERRLRLPHAAGDTTLHVESRELLACSTFHQGMFAEALGHARQGLALATPQSSGEPPTLQEQALLPACHTWEAHALWFLGYADQSLAAMKRALAAARDMRHDHSLSVALVQAAFLHQFRSEHGHTRAAAEEALPLAVALNNSYRQAELRVLLGWAQAMEAGASSPAMKQALALMEQGLDEVIAMGGCLDLPYFRGLLAEALERAGRPAEALQAVELALEEGHADKKRAAFFWDAELWRQRARLLLALAGEGSVPLAEACLQQALKAAQRQNARTPGLRAATDLAGLWQKQGRAAEAHALLQEHVDWFQEGFETADLKRAVALL